MEAFFIVFQNVAIMMAYLVAGLLIVKIGKARTEHAMSVSTLLIYVCGPCMVINSFLGMEFSAENNIAVAKFFVVSFIIQILFLAIVYVFVRNKLTDSKFRILSVASVLGNVGFLGLPLVAALFPTEPVVAAYSSIYVMSMNILVFSVGVYMITGDKKYMSLKAILANPTTIAILIAMPFYIFDINLPEAATSGIVLMAKMTTPLCMVVLGMRLAAVNPKVLFSRPFAYITCVLKLFVFPLFAYMCVKFIPWFDDTFKVCMLVLSATPTAAIVLSLSEIHEQQQELSANVVLLSTIFSLISIPLMLLIV